MRKKSRTDWVRDTKDSNIAQKTIEEQEPSEEDWVTEGIDMNKKGRKNVHFNNDVDP